jgi:hypothetical protein
LRIGKNLDGQYVVIVRNVLLSIITIDITGIYFTEQNSHIVEQECPVTWTPGTQFNLSITISALHFGFPKSIGTILLLWLRSANGNPLFPVFVKSAAKRYSSKYDHKCIYLNNRK